MAWRRTASIVANIQLIPSQRIILSARGARDSLTSRAFQDVVAGIGWWRLWTLLGWNDISQRYRRSMLGPFWMTASMAVMVLSLGVLYGELFGIPLENFLPYLCVGILVWNFISSFLLEGGALFTGSESYIKQVKLPLSIYVFRSCWSKLIIFAHNAVIYVGVVIFFGIWPGATVLLAIPGLLLLTLDCALMTLFIGMVSSRFRDIPQLIGSVVQIVFFVTPIMWKPELLQHRTYIATLNPFFQMIEIVRAPLLGSVPSLKTYLAVLAITLINIVIVGAFFVRFRSRIAYWV
ncbi:ABC transporter permease [uncultured Bradyrhizobium sp.]|jgi:ABC-2 type transport system permease protein/lipopolysaccharide transport system permease protein|uniref:ABC transporter permease n=1 Tax=uncultured Bradyrhizobium sp. TaxID=199684 RepID=UPI002638CBD8|nr:ABC transporter permease [uncultured Bradyrhizobium sp.]